MAWDISSRTKVVNITKGLFIRSQTKFGIHAFLQSYQHLNPIAQSTATEKSSLGPYLGFELAPEKARHVVRGGVGSCSVGLTRNG
jgi:hypothetical protein